MKISNKNPIRHEPKYSLSSDYEFELKEWIQHVIDTAEKSGNISKRDLFIQLREIT